MSARIAWPRKRLRGASTVEAVIVLPIFLFLILAVMQAALVFYAKSSVNYATFEAARAGTTHGASVASINAAFQKGMLPYYGGGTTPTELVDTVAKVAADLGTAIVRIEILSPTQESFQDYGSPALQAQMKSDVPVIPNSGLDELTCPRDVPDCKSDPKTNASGQTLLDANLLKLRVTYGISPDKQMPLVGKFYTWALDELQAGADDAFKEALIKAGRIPIVTSTVMRMQSDIVRNDAMISSPGPGNDGKPTDPGDPPSDPGIPNCPWWDPNCADCPEEGCSPDTCSAPSSSESS
jgi:hypothetical protein